MDLIGAYLFVCRFLGHATDGDLDDAEWTSMVMGLARHTRSIGYAPREWQEALDRSKKEYVDALRGGGPRALTARFRECVAALRAAWQDEPGVLDGLIEEFWRRARIDGQVHPLEEHFIHEVERAWQQRVARAGTAPL